MYEGLIQNHLSQDEYFAFKEKYEAKIEAISKEIEQLKAGLTIIARQLEQYKMLSQDAQHIKEDRQLTAALIDRLIERVEVSKEKQITVHFRFQSEFEHGEEVLNHAEICNCPIYPLSLEDYKYDSMSIENQHLVLNEFVSSMPEFTDAEVLEFIDNGYSGTNFERPKVQELIELVRANQIDCIIVKDFSRFGRNSIETGYFIERVFPLFHTRVYLHQ